MAASAEIARRNGRKGGRPKGEANRLTRRLANEIARSGHSPIDVMLKNMWFWAEQAEETAEKVKALADLETDPDARAEAYRLLGRFLSFREKSQECAVDAAPYCHPKLASIDFNPNDDGNAPPAQITMTLLSSSAGEDRSYRDEPIGAGAPDAGPVPEPDPVSRAA
jgi:hypothetical protein